MKKERIQAFCQKHKYLLRAVLMSLLPLFCCLITCASQGKSIGQVYLPASEWNDELFYFKQVEGMVKFGYPYGYFGFNESHALKLSFAAWSPVLVFPWIIWGLVFEWNLLSTVLCNIVLMMLSTFCYVLLVKPTWKQLGILTILFCLFTPFTRYMLSGMPEVICFSLLIIFYGLSVSDLREKKTWKLVLLFVISSLLTLMRPYMLLFMLLPVGLWIKRSRKWGIIGSAAVLAVTGGLYAAIKHFLGAEYFTPLFDTTWVTTFLDQGILAGIKYILWRLLHVGRTFLSMTGQGFSTGLAAGAFFGGFLVIMGVLLWQTWVDYRKKQKADMLLNGHMAFCFVGMLAALLLMYKMTEGSKHLLTFIAVGIFAISRMETRFYKKAMLVGAVCAYLYSYMAVEPYDYQIPFAQEELTEEIGDWKTVFSQQLTLDTEDVPNFNNVVIWVFDDVLPQGRVQTNWQVLYALPEGFGISCCYEDYVISHFDNLKSKYLAVVSGGRIDDLCQEAKMEEVGRMGETVVYRRY